MERIPDELRRQQETVDAADHHARAAVTRHEAEGGNIRIAVNGRGRIDELYVSERLIRSPELEPLLVAAVNEALASAQAEYLRRFRANLDPATSRLVDAAEQFATELREEGGQRREEGGQR